MDNWLMNNSGGSGFPGVAFEAIGATIVGRIAADPRPVDTQYGERLVIDLEADARSTATVGDDRHRPDQGEMVTLWIKPGAQARALRDALAAAKVEGLRVGDTLAVSYHADGDKKPGMNAAKLYRAEYSAAAPAVAVSESLL